MLCGEDCRFTWLNSFPPSNPNVTPALSSLDLGSDKPEPDVSMTDDADRDAKLDDAPNGAMIDEPMDDSTPQCMPSVDSDTGPKARQRAHST